MLARMIPAVRPSSRQTSTLPKPGKVPFGRARGRRNGRREDGFTLLELMVIVLIVMVVTALAAPSAVRAFAIFRAQAASLEVLRMARLARREAIESGRAIVVRTVGTRMEVRRGTTNLCRTSNWAAQFGDGCSAPADLSAVGSSCLGYVDPDMFSVGGHSVEIGAPDGQDICYQPNGEAMYGTSGGTVFSRPPVGGLAAVRFDVRRLESGVPPDPVRTILFPVDASPRSVR